MRTIKDDINQIFAALVVGIVGQERLGEEPNEPEHTPEKKENVRRTLVGLWNSYEDLVPQEIFSTAYGDKEAYARGRIEKLLGLVGEPTAPDAAKEVLRLLTAAQVVLLR